MSHVTLPQPPQSSLPAMSAPAISSAVNGPAANKLKAMDLAFLGRCQLITVITGAAFALALLAWSKSPYVALSYFAGSVFGAVMLASLTVFVRRLSASKTGTPYQGWDASIPLWALAGAKYAGLIFVAWGVAAKGWAQPFAFLIGIALIQVVIVARAMGRKMVSSSIAEIYIDNAKR